MLCQFLERFQELQSNLSTTPVQVRKAPPTRKSSRPNIDDTDTEDDTDACEAAVSPGDSGMVEWKSYLSTREDIPDGMSVVRWWGVSDHLFHCVHHSYTV
jgi:hypothetical protein